MSCSPEQDSHSEEELLRSHPEKDLTDGADAVQNSHQPEITDVEIFWALEGQSAEEFPDFGATLEKYGVMPRTDEVLSTVSRWQSAAKTPLSIREYIGALLSQKRVVRESDRFLAEVKKRGLIQPKPLSLREYIGAMIRPRTR